VRKMMQRVVSDKGTGKRASVANYSVAGKTGTVHKFIAGGYAEDRYLSIFAGMVPADKPELVMVVMIDEPRNGEHYGGLVAAPVFSQVMSGAMRLLDIAPDRISKTQLMNAGAFMSTDGRYFEKSQEGGAITSGRPAQGGKT
jgi:cell division protein FtsI (penicillin-binding protein 3)